MRFWEKWACKKPWQHRDYIGPIVDLRGVKRKIKSVFLRVIVIEMINYSLWLQWIILPMVNWSQTRHHCPVICPGQQPRRGTFRWNINFSKSQRIHEGLVCWAELAPHRSVMCISCNLEGTKWSRTGTSHLHTLGWAKQFGLGHSWENLFLFNAPGSRKVIYTNVLILGRITASQDCLNICLYWMFMALWLDYCYCIVK